MIKEVFLGREGNSLPRYVLVERSLCLNWQEASWDTAALYVYVIQYIHTYIYLVLT